MLDLTGIKIVVEETLLEYICNTSSVDFVTLITNNDEIIDIDVEDQTSKSYTSLEELVKDSDLNVELSDFNPVEDKILSKYFKLIYVS